MKYLIHQCVASRLRRLSRVADGYLRNSLADFDITENQMNILFVLHKTNEIEQGAIGKILFLERSTVSRAVKLLEKKNYIFKSIDYQPKIKLTNSGEKLVLQLIPIWEKFMDEICDLIGKDGLNQIEKLEMKIVKV